MAPDGDMKCLHQLLAAFVKEEIITVTLLLGRDTSPSKREIVDICKLAYHVIINTFYCIYTRRPVKHGYRLYYFSG